MTPGVVKTAVGNFFSNAGDVWTAVNNVLQGNFADGANDFMRFAINTTIGVGGLIDVASSQVAVCPNTKQILGKH